MDEDMKLLKVASTRFAFLTRVMYDKDIPKLHLCSKTSVYRKLVVVLTESSDLHTSRHVTSSRRVLSLFNLLLFNFPTCLVLSF
jgi:hypothetical protein